MTEPENTPKQETQEEANKKAQEPPAKRRLLRSTDDRVLAGVAGGLAVNLGIDPTLVRLGFVVATFFGGFGILAYLIMAVVVPSDDGSPKPVAARVSPVLRVIAIIVLIGAGITAGVTIAALSGWAAATGNGAVVAGIVIALGLGVAATAFLDARSIAPWLLGGALLVAVPAGAVAAADVHFEGSIGQREYRPASLDEVPADGYELGAGQLIVDLRDIPWQRGQTISLSSDLGMGQMIVSVPSNVCVEAHTKARAGELLVRGSSSSGVDPEYSQTEPVSKAPRLQFDGEIQFGQLVVTDRDPDAFNNDRNGDGSDPAEQTRARAACGR